MIFDSVRHGSPVPESLCRRKNETMNDIRRKRRELRRIKLLGLRNKRWKHGLPEVRSQNDCSEMKTAAAASKLNPKTAIVDIETANANHGWKCANTDSEDRINENDIALGGGSTVIRGLACHRHDGSVSVIGRRRAMEDALAVELGFLTRGAKTYDFFGVYDGHGGSRVAQSCRETLHRLVGKIVEGEEGDGEIDWGKVMESGFREMDEEVNRSGEAVAMVGSTAVVAVVGEEVVVVANCGDSRAVISRGGVAVQLSDDHKPDRPDELERIVGLGGKVVDWNGQRVLGVLATSRSIGDTGLRPFVIPDPEVRVVNRTDLDEFFILASDGLWDVVSNDLACQVVRKCLNGRTNRTSRGSVDQQDIELGQVDETKQENNAAVVAATVLVQLAMARGSRDNISVIVVDLRRSTHPVST